MRNFPKITANSRPKSAALRATIFALTTLLGCQPTDTKTSEKTPKKSQEKNLFEITNSGILCDRSDSCLVWSDFPWRNLAGTQFRNCDLRFANFCGTTLRDSTQRNQNLPAARLDSAIFDDATIFPPNFSPTKHGMLHATTLQDPAKKTERETAKKNASKICPQKKSP